MTAATDAPPDLAGLLLQWTPFVTLHAARIARRFDLELEDVAAEIHFEVVRRIGAWDPRRGAFSTWLGTVVIRGVRRKLADELAHRVPTINSEPSRRGRGGREDQDSDPVTGKPDPNPPPGDVAAAGEVIARVREALDRLPDRDQELLTRVFWAGETARGDGAKLSRALARLREHLTTTEET